MVLGFNNADNRQVALDYLKDNRVTFPNILDSSVKAQEVAWQYETLGRYGMGGVPLTYLLDRDGKVVEAWYGYTPERIEKALMKLGL